MVEDQAGKEDPVFLLMISGQIQSAEVNNYFSVAVQLHFSRSSMGLFVRIRIKAYLWYESTLFIHVY